MTKRTIKILWAGAFFLNAAIAQIQVKPLLDLERHTSEPSLSPDGKTLAFEWCKPDYSCGIYTRPLVGGEIRLLTGRDEKDGLPASPRWSPDGTRIAFARIYSHFDNHLFVRDLSSGGERDFGTVCDRVVEARWSPNGRFLIASVYKTDPSRDFTCRLVLFSAETGKVIQEIAPHGGAAAFSPDGRILAYGDDTALMLLKLTADYRPTGPPAVVVREPREISYVEWVPDGKQILYQVWGDVPYLRRVAARGGAHPRAISKPTGQLSISQLLGDGRALATETTRVEALWQADLTDTPVSLQTVSDAICTAGGLGCSPDGRQRVFISARTGISEIWLANGDGANERPLVKSIPAFVDPRDDGVPGSVNWSPDGKWIAFTVFPRHGNADVRSYLYVVPATGGMPRRLGKDPYALDNPAWSPDSKSLYAGQGWRTDDPVHGLNDPIVRVDLTTGTVSAIGADGMWPQLSRDGKFVYFFTSPRPKLSRISTRGGAPERLWDKEDLLWYCAGVGARFLYLFQELSRSAQGQIHNIIRFDPESRQATVLADVPFRPRSAYLSADERFLYFQQEGDPKQRVVFVDGLF